MGKQIPVEQAKAGMILARDLTDLMDRVIMKIGTALTAPYIKKLSRWGIEMLEVQAEEGEESADVPTLTPERIAEVEHMFEALEGHPRMIELKSIALANQFL